MPWNLVTASDERERCMVEIAGVRCEHPTAWKVAGAAWDDYALVCGAHLELVLQPGMTVEPVTGPGSSPPASSSGPR